MNLSEPIASNPVHRDAPNLDTSLQDVLAMPAFADPFQAFVASASPSRATRAGPVVTGDPAAPAVAGSAGTESSAPAQPLPSGAAPGQLFPTGQPQLPLFNPLTVPRAPTAPTEDLDAAHQTDSDPPGGIRPQVATVHALFDLGTPTGDPFPSNWLTVPDGSQNTGRRVNLPLPDPGTNLSDYQDTKVINTLDGFNLQPRLSVPFDGPIDVNTVNSQTVFLVSLGDTLNPSQHQGEVVGINQVVWDVATTTLHAESDQLLAQHTRYALIVTNGIHDTNGNPVEATEDFRDFRETVYGGYNHDLLDGIHAARRLGVRERDIVTASVFSTQSATAILEKIRDQIHAATPAPADFLLGADGTRAVFQLDDVTGITWNQHTGDNPPSFNPVNLNLSLLRNIPGAIGQIAFGKYLSPDYQVHPGEYIPPVGTRTGIPAVQGVNEIYFNLVLPSGPEPAGGWPVAIFGHGGGLTKQGNGNPGGGSSLAIAATLAKRGIATIAINAIGFGFGPLSTLTVNQTGGPVTFSAGGRSIDQNGDHLIGISEGRYAAPPRRRMIDDRDEGLQTVADLMQLVRVIEVGMDVDANGFRDLDPSHIYYVGQSFGGTYGTAFLAVEPSVRAGVLNVAAETPTSAGPLSPVNRGGNLALVDRTPSVLNAPGITSIEGVPAGSLLFNENLPLRNGVPLAVGLADGTMQIIQSPVINVVAGAMKIQELLDWRNWVMQSANPVAYASHLRKDPLPGVPAKSVLFQFDKGDQTVSNPATTAILRAGNLVDRATLYRNDLGFAEDPTVPKNAHLFLTRIEFSGLAGMFALGAQEQIGSFFASDGTEIVHPEPARFFEVPIQGPLPEDLNYIP